MDYNDIKKFETARMLREWLPYSKGSPKQGVTYDDQYSRANLLFFTDSHIDLRNCRECLQNVADTVDFANDSPVKLDAVLHGGDIITPFFKVKKEVALQRAGDFFDIAKRCRVPFLFAKGNHDLNDWANLPEEMLTDDDWGELFLNHAEQSFGIVRQTKSNGNRSTWHYYDIEEHKIRVVILDTQDTDKTVLTDDGTVKYHGGESFYFSDEQLNWVVTDALCFDDKPERDWGVVFCFHMYNTTEKYHEAVINKLLGICTAFGSQGSYYHKYEHPENPFFNLDIKADFTRYAKDELKPHVICFLLGHHHEDKNEVVNGMNIIWTLNGSSTEVSSDARMVRVPGTVTQNAFDIVNIDTRQRKIRLFRYGAGVNCYGIGGNRFLPDGLDY